MRHGRLYTIGRCVMETLDFIIICIYFNASIWAHIFGNIISRPEIYCIILFNATSTNHLIQWV